MSAVSVNKQFVQTVEFGEITKEWVESKKFDYDLKVLVIENCPKINEVADELLKLNLQEVKKLFVLVLEFLEEADHAYKEVYRIKEIFHHNQRPIILQLNSLIEKNTIWYFGDYWNMGSIYYKIPTSKDLAFDNLLLVHGGFKEDILKIKMSVIAEAADMSQAMSESILCLRVMNLFEGGCKRIVPWLTEERIFNFNNLETFFAFIDYPFDTEAASNYAWELKRFDYLEIFITRNGPFPLDFDLNLLPPEKANTFREILDYGRNLNRAIKYKLINEASTILDGIAGRLKYAFNEKNESAMSVVLQNFSIDMYALLLKNKMEFCGRCVELMKQLPDEQKKAIAVKNLELLTPFPSKPGRYPILTKCRLMASNSNKDFCFKKIREFFVTLIKHPDTSPLLKLTKKCPNFLIVFDFNHNTCGMMNPSHKRNFKAWGLCSKNIIYISAKRTNSLICGTIAHELTHSAMLKLYNNNYKPYLARDRERTAEFDKIVAECKKFYDEKKDSDLWDFHCVYKSVEDGTCYKEEEIAIELIARIPQMLVEKRMIDQAFVDVKYAKLLDFYTKFVKVDIEAALGGKNCLRRSKRRRKIKN